MVSVLVRDDHWHITRSWRWRASLACIDGPHVDRCASGRSGCAGGEAAGGCAGGEAAVDSRPRLLPAVGARSGERARLPFVSVSSAGIIIEAYVGTRWAGGDSGIAMPHWGCAG